MKKIILLLTLSLFMVSCLKEELAIKKPESSQTDSHVETLVVGSDYNDQLYYSLENQETVLLSNRESWDLAFETGADGFRVWMNSALMGGMKVLSSTNFVDVTTDNTTSWGYDAFTMNPDSTFIGDWRVDTDKMYLLFRGNNTSGVSLGKYKFKILSVTPTEYTIEYCKLDQTVPTQVTVTKNDDYSFSLFSFATGTQISTGIPPKTSFDFVLRTFTYVYPDGMPYLVLGCMLNNYNTKAVKFHSDNFAGITYEDALAKEYKSNVDVIGFDWKTYNFDTYLYTVNTSSVFIIKNQNNRYFKFRFLDFYDEFGVKGAPKMELIELLP